MVAASCFLIHCFVCSVIHLELQPMLDTQRDLVSLLNLGPPVTFLVNVVDLMYQTTTGQPLEKSSLLIPSCNVIRRQA